MNTIFRKGVCARFAALGAVVLCLGGAVVLGNAPVHAEEGTWIQLFNGKDLEGWTPKIKGYPLGENFGNTFRVEDGAITVGYEAYDVFNKRYGHLFYKTPYSKYRLRVEYRFIGEQANGGEGWALRNSGMMLHCQDPATMEVDQDFPVSIETQLLGGDGTADRTTCNVCTPGTNIVMNEKLERTHCINSTSKTFHGDQWVTAEVEVNGSGTIKQFINGELVLEFEQSQLDPRDKDAKKLIKGEDLLLSSGYISLQSESHPIQFRKVELMELK